MTRTSRPRTLSSRRWITGVTLTMTLSLIAAISSSGPSSEEEPRAGEIVHSNAHGMVGTIITAGTIDTDNPFFRDLGTNGRTCFTCHRPAQGWTITPTDVRRRFEQTGGLDPIFRTNDGSNCEGADVTTVDDRRSAFSLLLRRGVIRVGLDVPAGAEFEIVDVDDPYGCRALLSSVSMYRRPLPTTNLKFLSAVMWDGRDTLPRTSIRESLVTQAGKATVGHAQGGMPPLSELRAIVDFEMGISTAQTRDWLAGRLTIARGDGGPRPIVRQPFCLGINDPLGMLPALPGACAAATGVTPNAFTLFDEWGTERSGARAAIARGEAIFNTRQFVIDKVPGLNAVASDPVSGPLAGGTCSVCHDTPNAGNHSVAMALNIGIADPSRRMPDLPLYALRKLSTGDIVLTTDPGRAMVTGRWNDVGKFKGPVLRALAARAPYFHDGSAADLEEVIAFYNTRFKVQFTAQEKADLMAFLRAL
jgi:hypothetical protein